jgi:hypothetical protein
MLSRPMAGEEPRGGSHAAAGTKVRAVVEMVFEHAGEGFGHRDGFGAKGYQCLMRVMSMAVVFSAAIFTIGWA